MRRILLALIGLMLAFPAWADSTIPNLTAAGASAGGDQFPVSQSGGAATKQTISAVFATPPAIGATTPAAGSFTTLAATGNAALATLSLTGAGTFTSATFSGGIVLSGIGIGSQVACLGLDNLNNLIKNGAACGSGGGGTPGGSNGQIQYNNSGAFGGVTNATGALKYAGAGAFAQAACADLSNGVASCSTDTTNAANISSGTLPAARLPNPSATTLGGIESLAAVTSKWINTISTSGVPSATQPAFTDISGQAAFAQLPTIANNSVYGNSSGVPSTPSQQFVGAGMIMNANGLQTYVTSRTVSASTTVAGCTGSPCTGGDMGGIIYLTGTGTLTIPAISATILTTGMSVSYQNNGSGTWTISSSPAINGLPNTSVPPGGFGTLTGNGSSIDWTGLSPPTATEMGGVQSKVCAGSTFVSAINTDSTVTCNTPAGGGNVSTSGAITTHGVAIWASGTTIDSTATGTSGIPLIGQGAAADPIFGTAIVAGGGTGATTLTAHGVLLGEGTGAVVATAAGASANLLIGQGAADPTWNAMSGDATISAGGVIAVAKVGGDANVAFLDVKQKWTRPQAGTPVNVAIATSTFTPNFDTTQNLEIDLTSACPCTLANPSGTLVAGTSGMIEVHQDGTGSRTIGTYGTSYLTAGGTASITLSTAANAVDYLPYYVNNAATGIVLGAIMKNPTH